MQFVNKEQAVIVLCETFSFIIPTYVCLYLVTNDWHLNVLQRSVVKSYLAEMGEVVKPFSTLKLQFKIMDDCIFSNSQQSAIHL